VNGLEFTAGGHRWRADLAAPVDLAIDLDFGGPQPSFFVAAPAQSEPLQLVGFTGSVANGASCNCTVHTLAPHCHGTHTECVGHVTRTPVAISSLTPVAPCLALVVSVQPEPLGADASAVPGGHADATDSVIRRCALVAAATRWLDAPFNALVVRTRPNDVSKRHRAYSGSPSPAPYFLPDAMHWLVEREVNSLVVDLPSLDRADDGGRLAAHRAYWGLPDGCADAAQARRGRALVTELAYVPDTAADGLYLLDLQVPAFVADAAPSRPVLYPLRTMPGAGRR
jgi:arylformamidase